MIQIVQKSLPQSIFRIQRLSDFKDIGLGNAQYEKPWLRQAIRKKLNKKIGMFPKSSGMIAHHWRNINNGYPKDFIKYHTYGRIS